MKLSIVIPAYNERATITEIINKALNAPFEYSKELIIIDDCSTDGTREFLEGLSKSPEAESGCIKVLMHPRNCGKGAAIRTAIPHVTGDIVLIQDADLEYDPRDYPALLQPIVEGHADVVYGNRFHGGSHRVLYFWHFLGNRVLTTLTNLLTNLNLTDMEVGYKVFRTEVLKQIRIESQRFGFEPEITIKVAKLRCRLYEVPITYHGRTYDEGKKISWRDGVAALLHMIRYRFFD